MAEKIDIQPVHSHHTALFSTDLNLTTRGIEKHFSYFSEQISGIIPLDLLPAEVSCSVSLHHVKRDQVFVPTAPNWSPDPPLGLLLECVSQSKLLHPCEDTNLLFIFLRLQRQPELKVEMWRISLSAPECDSVPKGS